VARADITITDAPPGPPPFLEEHTVPRPDPDHGAYLPTPETIRRACERFQAGWSDEERTKRALGISDAGALPPRGPRVYGLRRGPVGGAALVRVE
jgi:hypothetical protein